MTSQLSEAAQAFKELMNIEPGAVVQDNDALSGDDLDAAIAARLQSAADSLDEPSPPAAESLGEADPAAPTQPEITVFSDTPLDEEELISETVVGEAKTTEAATDAPGRSTPETLDEALATTEPSQRTWQMPPPVLRSHGRRKRVSVEVPAMYEALRLEAKQVDITCGHLVLSVLAEHGDDLLEQALTGVYTEQSPVGLVSKWQLMLNDSEIEQLNEYVAALTPHIARKSRALTISLLLGRCG